MQSAPLILSAEELRGLTGRYQRAAQMRVLDELGVPLKRRPDGSIVVFRAAAERACGLTVRSVQSTETGARRGATRGPIGTISRPIAPRQAASVRALAADCSGEIAPPRHDRRADASP
jgi:hypothetical protein